jgi:hypothetical protein
MNFHFSLCFQVDVVAGPDAYRDLPRLLAVTHFANQPAINVILSLEVTVYPLQICFSLLLHLENINHP